MRLIYLHQHFATPEMSGGTYSYEMARRFVAHGHEVHMVTADRSGRGRGWFETEEAGIHVHWCPIAYSNHMGFKRRIISFMEFAWAAARKAVTLPGDVVYASSSPLTIALPGVHVSRRKSIPMIFEVADLWPELPIAVGALKSPVTIAAARRLERFAYQNSAHIVAFSPTMKEGIVATGYPAEKVTVIPNNCDIEQFRVSEEVGRAFRRRYAWLGDRPLVVYAGTFGFINGVDYLARLAAVVKKRDADIRFLVIGSGSEEEKVRRAAQELGVLDRNFFMEPPVAKSEIQKALSAADICTSVFIDLKEMWANSASKVFDTLAAGRPLAINHEGWHAETIRETGCGLVLNAHNMESAAGKLVAAVRNKQWLADARAAARRVAEERFERNKLARLWESVVLGVASEQQKRVAA